jgi:hypothetical protein
LTAFAVDGFAGLSRDYAFMPTIAFLCRLAAAADLEMRMGSRAMLVHTRLDWARALRHRSQPGDAVRAHDLLQLALGGAKELDLTGTEHTIAALLVEAGV